LTGLTPEQIMLRIERTDPETLRASAKAFDAAAEAFGGVRGRMLGVISDTHRMWNSAAGRAFEAHSEEVLRGLGDVGYTLGFLGRNLREHAAVAESARSALPLLRKGPPDHPYMSTDIGIQNIIEGTAKVFHDSELKLKKAFFSWGATAPGKLPIPALPPPEKQSWWESLLFGPGPEPTWVDKDGDTWHGQGDPYGYDEDGNLVPVYMAAYPDEWYPYQEAGGGGAIFRWLLRAGRAARGVRDADEFMEAVTSSRGWRPGHIERHIREFYNLPEDAEVPQWMRDEFTRLVRSAGENSGKVFRWQLRGETAPQPTNTIIYRDTNTKKWIAVQFYENGPRAGEFATAFEPTPAQLDAMLRQNALG
jgi:uncharacterized protein YukE